jgi:hypothetical protein
MTDTLTRRKHHKTWMATETDQQQITDLQLRIQAYQQQTGLSLGSGHPVHEAEVVRACLNYVAELLAGAAESGELGQTLPAAFVAHITAGRATSAVLHAHQMQLAKQRKAVARPRHRP